MCGEREGGLLQRPTLKSLDRWLRLAHPVLEMLCNFIASDDGQGPKTQQSRYLQETNFKLFVFMKSRPLTKNFPLIMLVYLDGQKVVLIYDELMFSFQIVHLVLQLSMHFLLIPPLMSLQDQLCLLLFQLLVCNYTTLVNMRLIHTWQQDRRLRVPN